jgi:hypothetical protein
MKAYGGWRYNSTIHNLGTRWRWVVSFMLLPFCNHGYGPRYLMRIRLGEPQSRTRHCAEEISPSLVSILTELFRLQLKKYDSVLINNEICKYQVKLYILQVLQTNSVIVPHLSNYCFLPNPLQFIYHPVISRNIVNPLMLQ